jgi:integrase/recombinase XerD
MSLTIFRRHVKSCGQKSRRFRRCKCPISVEGTLGGEEIRKALDLTSWEAAENVVHEWNRAGKIGAEGRRSIQVKDAVLKFLADARARIRESTVQLYEQSLLRELVPWCEKENVRDVERVSVETLRRYRESWKCAAVTAARRLDRLRTFFGFCLDSGWIETNPAKALKAPAVKCGLKMPFTEDELAAIFSACDRLVTRGTYGTENKARVKAFVYILRYTGLRISDASHLDETRVKDGRVFLRTEKTGTLVWVPIPKFVVDALSDVPRTGAYYFQTGNAKAKTVRGGWDRTLRTIFKLAGVKHGSAHVFRHTLATDLLSNGVAVETVAAILGNSPAIVLKHYAPWVKARQDALEDAIRKVWDEPKPKLKVIQGGA